MLGLAIVGASSDPPNSMTRTCAPDADNSAARTEPDAPAPTTMKSYRLSSFDSLIILELPGLIGYHPLHKYSGEVLAVPIENNQPQDCHHRRRYCSARIQERVIANNVHDDWSKQH